MLLLRSLRCWDGKNLDSPDHQSHMYNNIEIDDFKNAPYCPSTHPVRVPQVTFEATWYVHLETFDFFGPFQVGELYLKTVFIAT